MAKKYHSNSNEISNARKVKKKASCGVRSTGKEITQIAVSPPRAGTSGSVHDDMLQHLGSLIDSVKTGIISLDGDGRIRVFNAVVEKLFGLPRVMVMGRLMNEIGRMMGFDDHGRRALWERISDAVWAAGAALDLEFDLITRRGKRTVMSYSVYPIGRMAWSVGNGVVIMLEDITRKKEMEDQISDARKKLLAVFDGITDGIQVLDSDFRITAVNKSMTTLLAREIRIGAHCFEACSFGTKICLDCPAEETFRTGQPASITKRLLQRTSNGQEAGVAEISTFPLLDRGNRVTQVVEYIKDVTEKVRLAERLEQSRRLAELGEMSARVAHEVRNPLNAIIGAAHFLSTEYPGDETLRNFTDLIKRQANRVNQVASDLLYVSKPVRMKLTTVQIAQVIDQALDSLREQLRDQKIEVVRDGAPDTPSIQADELQIEQALQNILRNAVEAMPSGGVLRISSRPVLPERNIVEIRIQDTGPGIPEQDRERIFQSFYTTRVRGTGLGLTIVQRVLKNHGGEVVMEHPKTGGTIVLVRLPVKNGFNVQSPSLKAETDSDAISTPHTAHHLPGSQV